MSLKESTSRVKNIKQFNSNFDRIFKKNKSRRKNKSVIVNEKVKTELYGTATRYYYSDTVTNTRNKTSNPQIRSSQVERKLRDFRVG